MRFRARRGALGKTIAMLKGTPRVESSAASGCAAGRFVCVEKLCKLCADCAEGWRNFLLPCAEHSWRIPARSVRSGSQVQHSLERCGLNVAGERGRVYTTASIPHLTTELDRTAG